MGFFLGKIFSICGQVEVIIARNPPLGRLMSVQGIELMIVLISRNIRYREFINARTWNRVLTTQSGLVTTVVAAPAPDAAAMLAPRES